MTILEISPGDTAWVLISAAMVLLMTPALAFFYGGMVRSKSVLNMMMMSMVTAGLVAVLWVGYGFSMAFGNSVGGLVGHPLEFAGLGNLAGSGDLMDAEIGTVPALVFVGFQAAFAIIAVALISGAVADRMKFSAWCAFAVIWASLVYFPAAHWVFAFDGMVAERGGFIANQIKAFDFAGGTAIHINAGAAALALALVLGPRIGFGKVPMRPHNLTLVMLGAALLWFGWFGFNAGSALGASALAGLAWVNTLVAPAAAMLAWLVTERVRDGHATSLGAASGIVAGLVAITPACAVVTPFGAIAIGALAGVGCSMALSLKFRLGYDDSLDVVGVHLVGGLIGTLAIGLFADAALTGSPDSAGLLIGGGMAQLGRQAIGAGVVLIYSFLVTLLIALVLKRVMGLRVSPAAETSGIDVGEHAETGYDLSKVQYSSYNVRKTLLVPAEKLSQTTGIGSTGIGSTGIGSTGTDTTEGVPVMKLITAVLREDAVDDVQIALAHHGISGMTVTEVSGYAHQRGHTEVYRGEEFTIDFITKIRIDVVVKDADVSTIVETICRAARSGNIGDGKVWVQPVEDVVRVRTGEHGESAI